jgi:hypothetical protein
MCFRSFVSEFVRAVKVNNNGECGKVVCRSVDGLVSCPHLERVLRAPYGNIDVSLKSAQTRSKVSQPAYDIIPSAAAMADVGDKTLPVQSSLSGGNASAGLLAVAPPRHVCSVYASALPVTDATPSIVDSATMLADLNAALRE